jgi:hypothetical protein
MRMSSEVRRHTVQGGAWDLSDRHLNACPLARVKQKIHRQARECAPIATLFDQVRTRTSIVGMTIYMPDIKPSARGRKLLEALERLKG